MQETGIGTKPHGGAFLLNLFLRLHKMDHWMGTLLIKLARVCPAEPADITGELDHRHLHAQTDAEEGDAILASIAHRLDLPFTSAIPKPTWH